MCRWLGLLDGYSPFYNFWLCFSSSSFLDKKYLQSQNWSLKVVDIPFKVNNFLPKHKVQRSCRHFCFLCDDIVPKQIKSGQKPKELSQFSKQISRSTNLPKKLWSDQVFKRALEMEPEFENWLISNWTCDTVRPALCNISSFTKYDQWQHNFRSNVGHFYY